jgi:RHS repeat-associated protein
MLDEVGLVHMNGRIYDPLLGRFLSADVAIQAPGNLQSYNRYSYVMNNPLTLTDPTGWFFMQMMPDWMQQAVQTGAPGFVAADTAKEAGAVYNLGMEHGDGAFASGATAGAVGLTRFTGAMDWSEAVHGEKIVLSNGSASTTEITDPKEVASKAVFGAAGMVMTGVGGASAIESRLNSAAPKTGAAPEVKPNTAPSTELKEVTVDASKHPETAQHVADAQAAGHPDVVTVDRPGAPANRQAATGSVDKVPGKQLDEYPPAMFKEGGQGASVRAITPKDNMGAGASMGNQLRGVPDGTQVKITVKNLPDGQPSN